MFPVISRFIIFVAGRIRQGQFPRLPDFPYSAAHGQYIYQGRELDEDEFNVAAAKVFSPNYRNKGFNFQPMVVVPVVEDAAAAAEPVAAAQPPADEPEAQPETSAEEPYTIADGGVFHDGSRVATILEDGSLRMARGFSTLRPDIEAWMNTNPEA